MTNDFSRALEAILQRADPPPRREGKAAPATAAVKNHAERRSEWFAKFAAEKVMPLLREVTQTVEKHGATATCRLGEENGHLAAELVIVPKGLPRGALPPRLTVYAAEGERPLMIEYTGTFPHAGGTGGFGAEIDFDPIFSSQVKEKILDFVALATGA